MVTSNFDWKIPEKINEFILPKFPVEDLPKILREYSEALAEELQVPVDMVATSVITSCALCNQGKYKVEGKIGWFEPINLYAINIARPSERKSPTMAKIIKPIVEYEQIENENRKIDVQKSKEILELYNNRLFSLKKDKKKDINELQKEISDINLLIATHNAVDFIRLLVDDITPEALIPIMAKNKEKIGLFSSEGGIFNILSGQYNNNIANFDIFLKSYSGDKTSVDRVGSESKTLYTPCMTILLFVQPEVVENLFSNNLFRGKGLCARFLYSCPESIVGNRNSDSQPIPKEIEKEYINLIRCLLEKDYTEFKILKLSEKAYEISQNFSRDLEPRLISELEGIEDWAGKFHGTVLRIAANLHLAENYNNNNNLVISEDTIIHAINIGYYYLEHAKNIYGICGTNQLDIDAKRIVRILKKNGIIETIKRGDLFKMCRGKNIKNTANIDRPLEYLESLGYVKIKDIPKESLVGRNPDKMVFLNPYIFK